jgi:hypothetical protein
MRRLGLCVNLQDDDDEDDDDVDPSQWRHSGGDGQGCST